MTRRASYDSIDYTPRNWQASLPPDADPEQVEEAAKVRVVFVTETSRRFHDLMDAAMLVSFYKYGPVAQGYPDRVNAIESLKLRLEKYAATGNAEYLVDVANFAMIEFMHPAHPEAFYKATDKDGSPGRVAANATIYDKPNQYANRELADADEKPF